jgi:TctA family transporter
VVTRDPELFWGLIASMWVGNAMLVILNLPLIGIFAGGNLRCAMLLADDDPRVFLTRPITAVLLAIGAVTLMVICLPAISSTRTEVFVEDARSSWTIACWPESHRRTQGRNI